MDEIRISTAQVIGLGISALVNLLLPFAFWIFWRRRTHASWVPLLAGLIGYLVAGMIHGVARTLLLSGMTPWLYYFWQAAFAAVFEEGARYLIFRYAIPIHDRYRDSIACGIGHGGLEHLLVNAGPLRCYGFLVAWFYRTEGADAFVPGGGGAFLMEGLNEEGIREVLAGVADGSAWMLLLESMQAVAGLLLHICLSVLVFTAVHFAVNRKWLFAAIGLHMLGHLFPALNALGALPRSGAILLDCILTAGIVYLTYRVWEICHHETNLGEDADFR